MRIWSSLQALTAGQSCKERTEHNCAQQPQREQRPTRLHVKVVNEAGCRHGFLHVHLLDGRRLAQHLHKGRLEGRGVCNNSHKDTPKPMQSSKVVTPTGPAGGAAASSAGASPNSSEARASTFFKKPAQFNKRALQAQYTNTQSRYFSQHPQWAPGTPNLQVPYQPSAPRPCKRQSASAQDTTNRPTSAAHRDQVVSKHLQSELRHFRVLAWKVNRLKEGKQETLSRSLCGPIHAEKRKSRL